MKSFAWGAIEGFSFFSLAILTTTLSLFLLGAVDASAQSSGGGLLAVAWRVTTLESSVATQQTTLTTLQGTVAGIQTGVNGLQSNLPTIQATIASLQATGNALEYIVSRYGLTKRQVSIDTNTPKRTRLVWMIQVLLPDLLS